MKQRLGYLVWFALVLASCGEQVVVRETRATCGNGQVEVDEACDDGNDVNSDACSNACELASCGDAVTRMDRAVGEEGYEACDDGNDVETDGCTSSCLVARCGDGLVRSDASEGSEDYEACDDGNEVDTDACRNDCSLAFCGDGVLRTDLSDDHPDFEACDDGNDDETMAVELRRASVRRRCRGARERDDANDDPTDACRSCQLATCGDGVIQGDERCDDGSDETDACLSTCAPATCGDGVVYAGVEGCDDGARSPPTPARASADRSLWRRDPPPRPCSGRSRLRSV